MIYYRVIKRVSKDVCGARMCPGDYLIAHSLQGGELTLLWYSPEGQDFFHLTLLRHQNINNDWVFAMSFYF